MSIAYLEKQVMGCFLQDDSLLDESNINSHHFTNDSYQALHKVMKELKAKGKQINSVTLITNTYDMLGELGGPDVITDLSNKGNPSEFESYESEILSAYKERVTEKTVQDWLEGNEKDPQKLMDNIERIQDEAIQDESYIIDILSKMHEEPYQEAKEALTGIPSGIQGLDDLTGGWQPKNSIILGARPSMGKTATMLKFMLGAIENGDVPIIFSLEMSTESLLRRAVSSVGVINGFAAKNPAMFLSEGKKSDWADAIGKLSSWEYEIWDNSSQTIQYIRSKVRKAKKKYAGKRVVVFIDYMGLIKNDGSFASTHEKMTDVSRRLKAMAKDYEIPVVTLAQLSRSLESRQDKRPLNSDLRESGSIEEDADLIIFLYRESYYDKENESNELEIILSKHRDGPTGIVEVDYNRETGVIRG